MSSQVYSALLPTKRSRNTSILWMLFSTVWVGILTVGLIRYWRIPDDSIYDTPVHFGFKVLATVLVVVFTGVYVYTLFRMYFRRTSWLTVFSPAEFWWIRGLLLGVSIQLNILPSAERADWQSAFVFAAIGWALTSNHQNAIGAVFAVAAVAAGTLLITGNDEILVGTMLYIIGFGVMVSGYVMMNGLVGELMIERGRVADQAVTEERFRLARDLHDTVGHSMTQITLKTELARRILSSDPERAERELTDVEHLSRTLSAEVRRSIAGETDTTLERECARAMELLLSLDIAVTIHGEPAAVPTGVANTFAWCLREGVINVAKHSGASRCHISIDSNTLIINDNGDTVINTRPGGQGIEGMKQRLSQHEGAVRLTETPNGHRLEVRIPT